MSETEKKLGITFSGPRKYLKLRRYLKKILESFDLGFKLNAVKNNINSYVVNITDGKSDTPFSTTSKNIQINVAFYNYKQIKTPLINYVLYSL